MSQGEKQPTPVPSDAEMGVAGGPGALGTTLAGALDDLLGGGA